SLLLLCVLSIVRCGWSETVAESLVTDKRVKTFTYSDNQVYELVAYYGYFTDVELGADEDLKTVSAGDSAAFQIKPADGGHHIFIKPMAHGARTNLSVITSKRIYIFDLTSRSVQNPDKLTYFVRFVYPRSSWLKASHGAMSKDPSQLHFDYSISG